MSDFAENINEKGQDVLEDLFSSGERNSGIKENSARPEIKGEISFASIIKELQDSDQNGGSSGSDLYMKALEGIMYASRLDEAQLSDVTKINNTQLSADMLRLENVLDNLNLYINARGARKLVFFKGAITPKGKKRYNAMCKARLAVEALHDRLQVYYNTKDFSNSSRKEISKSDRNSIMTVDAAPDAIQQKINAANQLVLDGKGKNVDATYEKLAGSVFYAVKLMIPSDAFFTPDRFKQFMFFVNNTGFNVFEDVTNNLNNPTGKGAIIRKSAKKALGATSDEHFLLLSNIMQNTVELIKELRKSTDEMSFEDSQIGGHEEKIRRLCFKIRMYLDAYNMTDFWSVY